MSQITRCPHCATAFKVVADQLRISDGWVRCGHCKEVFDASEHLLISEPEQLLPEMPLQDLPAAHTPAGVHVWGSAREAVPAQAASEPPANFEARPTAAGLQESAALAQPAPAADPDTQETHTLVHEDAPDAASAPAGADGAAELVPLSSLLKHESFDRLQTDFAAPAQEPKGYELPGTPDSDSIGPQDDAYETAGEPEHAPHEPMPAPGEPAAVADVNDDLVEQAELQVLAPVQAEPPLAEEAALMPVQTLADAAQAEAAAAPDAPGFVLAARRKVFWGRPGVLGALAAMGLVFALALALQMLLQERDLIAARHPALHGLLTQLCQPLQCSIQAPRSIDAVAIDSSSFVKAPRDGASYELQVGIKNNAAFAVAMPALELTLTDAQDQTLIRRVLLRNELMAPVELAPGAVWSTAVPMQVVQGASLVAGYRLLAFYP